MTKEEMVHKLVAHSVQTALAESKRYWLKDLFERGFAGYRNYSTEQLRRELQLRGLTEPLDELANDDSDGELDWEDDAESVLDLELDTDSE